TWLYTIVRSVCIDAIRKQKQSAGTVSVQESQEDKMAAENLHVLQPNPREHALQEEVGAVLERLVRQLPREQREVLLMREKLNLQFKEIAQITGCTIGTVKSRMRYALDTLRKSLIAEGLIQ
ncbi:MAG: sigma-70 family RNA polymerase sigma factor, partial [bacterium]